MSRRASATVTAVRGGEPRAAEPDPIVGKITRVAGPVVAAEGLRGIRLSDVVRVGEEALVGEVIQLDGSIAVIQVYEETGGLRVGEPVVGTGAPLQVELGPGLLGMIYDGIQRPLPALAEPDGDSFRRPFIPRGASLPALDRARAWEFAPAVREGEAVSGGDLLGTVQETPALEHRVLVPDDVAGIVTNLRSGPCTIEDSLAWVGERPVSMLRRWPVRRPRPIARRLDPDVPLVTGQRVIDTLFPIARGGVAVIPGGFGTGKTIQEQALARWSDADVVVYIACGERGNELTDVLDAFPRLTDPRTGAPLMDRTILIANTSNMPVAAREASVYTGMTLAEYYRDQGYSVAVLADSTSRWGEALREVSARLEEMPGEEGYPAYLAARLAEFYERAGSVVCLGADERVGAVTVIGAVSPPGGDYSEPVTQHSLRLAGTLWALDTDLARRRHFPAVHWSPSHSLYEMGSWFGAHVDPAWEDDRRWVLALLQREEELLDIVQLLGPDALAPSERVILATGRRLRQDFLQQSAFDEMDAFCPPPKQHAMLALVRHLHERCVAALEAGGELEAVTNPPVAAELAHMKEWAPQETVARAADVRARIDREVRVDAAE